MPKSIWMSVLSITVFALLPNQASAYPRLKPGMSIMTLPKTFTANYDFEGIVSLNGCSGSLVRFENSKDSDLGMVLTNGHCSERGFPQPGEVVYGQPSRVIFGLLNSKAQTIGSTQAKEIIYSTMTKTDVTLYRLRETYAAITARTGIRPLTMSSQHPKLNDKIEVISGYWKRGFTCSVDKFIYQLKEADWTCEDSMRYSQPGCETYGGTSGSPIILAGSRIVIGVNNTGNDNGDRCTENNPCEVDTQGNVSYRQGWSYGQQTYWFYSCLNSNNEVDLGVSGCLLPH